MRLKKNTAIVISSFLLLAFAFVPTFDLGRAGATGSSVAGIASPAESFQNSVGNSLSSVQDWASSKYPDQFNSVGFAPNGTSIAVYLTSSNLATEQAFKAELEQATSNASIPIQFISSAHSASYEANIAQEFQPETVWNGLKNNGIDIVSEFPFPDGLVHIGVENLTSSGLATLNQRFGAQNILVSNVTPAEAPTATANRIADTSPWQAGDNIAGSNSSGTVSGCTSGVGLAIGGTNYTLTASHCYITGISIYNELILSSGNLGSDALMGSVYSRDVSYGGADTALLSVTPSGYMWTGAISSPSKTVVHSYATNPVGTTLYNEGAYSGEVPVVVLSSAYGCLDLTGYAGITGSRHECHLVEADSTNGTYNDIANQDGDSGGPVIRYESGNLDVGGITSAGGGTIETCLHNATTCYNTIWYTPMDYILATEYSGSTLVNG